MNFGNVELSSTGLFLEYQYLLDFTIVMYVSLQFEYMRTFPNPVDSRILISRNLGKFPIEDISRNVF